MRPTAFVEYVGQFCDPAAHKEARQALLVELDTAMQHLLAILVCPTANDLPMRTVLRTCQYHVVLAYLTGMLGAIVVYSSLRKLNRSAPPAPECNWNGENSCLDASSNGVSCVLPGKAHKLWTRGGHGVYWLDPCSLAGVCKAIYIGAPLETIRKQGFMPLVHSLAMRCQQYGFHVSFVETLEGTSHIS